MTSVMAGRWLSRLGLSDAKLLRWYGIDRESNTKDFRCEADVENWGYKFHMNDVIAAVGIENLKASGPIVDAHMSNSTSQLPFAGH